MHIPVTSSPAMSHCPPLDLWVLKLEKLAEVLAIDLQAAARLSEEFYSWTPNFSGQTTARRYCLHAQACLQFTTMGVPKWSTWSTRPVL